MYIKKHSNVNIWAAIPLVIYPELVEGLPIFFAHNFSLNRTGEKAKKDFRSNLTKWFIDSNKKNKDN